MAPLSPCAAFFEVAETVRQPTAASRDGTLEGHCRGSTAGCAGLPQPCKRRRLAADLQGKNPNPHAENPGSRNSGAMFIWSGWSYLSHWCAWRSGVASAQRRIMAA